MNLEAQDALSGLTITAACDSAQTLTLAHWGRDDLIEYLLGADLRGAFLGAVDFYLVNLRNAKMDPQQKAYARSCGAILNDWGSEKEVRYTRRSADGM